MNVTANTGRRLAAEWEPQSFVQLTWPHAGTDWAPYLDQAYDCFLAIARAVAARSDLLVVTRDAASTEAQLRQADQYRMVGAALQVLRDHPVIDPQYLSGSLAQQNARIHVVLEKTTQDQLLKIWNNTSTTYKLSFVVLLTGVEIESRRERRFSRVTDVTITTDQKSQAKEEKP